jgi:hypothetical protein
LERKGEGRAAVAYNVGISAEELHGLLHELGSMPSSCSNRLFPYEWAGEGEHAHQRHPVVAR